MDVEKTDDYIYAASSPTEVQSTEAVAFVEIWVPLQSEVLCCPRTHIKDFANATKAGDR